MAARAWSPRAMTRPRRCGTRRPASRSPIVHSVDVVLRLDQEDDKHVLSCPSKNRFGLTRLVSRVRLTAEGFVEVDAEGFVEVDAEGLVEVDEEASATIEIQHGASS